MITLFENDASSARPDGSIEVNKVFWWEHNSKIGQFSSAKVHRSLKIKLVEGLNVAKTFEDYVVSLDDLDGLHVQIYDGI